MRLYRLCFMACLALMVSGCFIIFMALLPANKSWPNGFFLGFVYALSLVPVALGLWRLKAARTARADAGRVSSIALIVSGGCLFFMFLLAWHLFPKLYGLFPFDNIVVDLAFVLIGVACFAFYAATEKEGRQKRHDMGMGVVLTIIGCFFILVRIKSGSHHLSTGFELLTLGGAALLFTKLELTTVARFKGSRFGGLIILAVVLAYVLWAFAVSWLGTNIVQNIMALMSGPQEAKKPDGLNGLIAMFLAASGLGHSLSEKLSLAFNFWALAGAAGLVLLRYNPWRLDRWPQVTWGGLALGMLVGRPFVGWLSWAGTLLPEEGLFTIFSYAVAPPLIMLLAGGFALQTGLEMISWGMMESFAFCVALPVIMFNQLLQFDNTLKTYRQQQTGLVGYITRFGFWLRGEQPPDEPDDTKGARFATGQEVQKLCHTGGDAFGHVNGGPLCLANEKHTLIMASTRSGKGVSLIIPHLLRYKGSAFVLDPKGENAKATGRRRDKLNDTVCYLDPFGISGKPQSRFNPLSRFTPENMEAESKALAAALSMGDFGKRDHWTASAQQLLAALILYVYAAPEISEKEKDLGMVRRLLLRDCTKTLEDMKETTLADGLVAALAASFLQTPPTERGNIISTAQRETEILDNPFIIKCLSASGDGNEVDFKAWRNSSMTVFLCLSAPKFPVFSRWLRLVLTSALDEMTDTLNPPSLPVCFMLDELATLGHMSAVENAVGLAAGYGIQLWTVFQDVAQMKDLYKGRWASFIGNAGVRAVFSLQDYETAKYWSDFLGHKVVETRGQSQNIYGIAQSQSMSETMRPLLAPEEIMMQFANKRRANGHCPEPENMLVLAQGSCPIITKRVAYFDDDEFKKPQLWDDPRYRSATSSSFKAEPAGKTSSSKAEPVKEPPPPKEEPAEETMDDLLEKALADDSFNAEEPLESEPSSNEGPSGETVAEETSFKPEPVQPKTPLNKEPARKVPSYYYREEPTERASSKARPKTPPHPQPQPEKMTRQESSEAKSKPAANDNLHTAKLEKPKEYSAFSEEVFKKEKPMERWEAIVNQWKMSRPDTQNFRDAIGRMGVKLAKSKSNGCYAFCEENMNPIFLVKRGALIGQDDVLDEMAAAFKVYDEPKSMADFEKEIDEEIDKLFEKKEGK